VRRGTEKPRNRTQPLGNAETSGHVSGRDHIRQTALGIEKKSLVLCKQLLFVYSQVTQNEHQHLVMQMRVSFADFKRGYLLLLI